MVTLGDHQGGALRTWTRDQRTAPIDTSEQKGTTKLNPNKNPILFDGTQAHETVGFTGQRVALIFFRATFQNLTGANTARKLYELGFAIKNPYKTSASQGKVPVARVNVAKRLFHHHSEENVKTDTVCQDCIE